MNITVTVKGDKALTTAITQIGDALTAIAAGGVAPAPDEPTVEEQAAASEPEQEAETPKKKTTAKKTTAKKTTTKKEEPPAEEAAGEGTDVSPEDARLLLKEFSQLESKAAALALLKKHGAASFTAIPDDVFPKFVEELQSKLATAKGEEPAEEEESFLD